MNENPYSSNFVDTTAVQGARSQRLKFCACVLSGIAITPILLLLSVNSFGGGHGHYIAARASFPVPMLLTRCFGDSISLPIIILAICQYPALGCVLGVAFTRGWRYVILTLAVVIGMHGIAVLVAFSGLLSNFS